MGLPTVKDLVKTKLFSNIIVFLLFGVIFLSPLNHRELFTIYTDYLLPVRIFAFLLITVSVFTVNRESFKDTVFVLLLVFAIVVTFSSVASMQLKSVAFSFFFFLPLSFYSSIKFLYKNSKKNIFLLISKAYIFTSLLLFVVFVYQYVLYFNTQNMFGAVWPVTGRVPRFGSLFWDVNHYGFYLVSVFWVAVYLYFKSNKLMYIVYSVLLLVPLFFTSSRSSYLGFISSVILFLTLFFVEKTLIKNHLGKIFFFIGLAPFYIAGLTILVAPVVRDIFFYRIHSFFTHFILLDIGVNVFKQRPIFGVGVSNFDMALRASPYFEKFSLLDPGALASNVPLHSVWVQILSESGLFAFLTFAVLFLFGLFSLIFSYLKNNSYTSLSLASLLLAMGVSGIFYSYNLEFFWMLFVLCLFYPIKDLSNKKIQQKFVSTFRLLFNKTTLLFYTVVAAFIIFVVLNIDTAPSSTEIDVFNTNKVLNSYLFYSFILGKFQYMLGYFPFAGRLLSLVFFISALFVGLLNYKNKKILTLIFVTTIATFSLFGGFLISPSSFYIYIFTCVISVLLYLLNINIKFNFVYSPLFILLTLVSLFYLSFAGVLFSSFSPELSDLTKESARKFSISSFKNTTDGTIAPDQYKAINFYLEPDSYITSSSVLDVSEKYILYTKNENLDLDYTHLIKNGGYFAYIKYVKGY